MSERTILVTTDYDRTRLIRALQDRLRKRAIEMSQGTLERILDAYDEIRP
jgi:hypothetical protein